MYHLFLNEMLRCGIWFHSQLRINWDILDAHTKRPKTKRPKGQNVPREKTSQGTKRPKGKMRPPTWCGQLPNPIWLGQRNDPA